MRRVIDSTLLFLILSAIATVGDGARAEELSVERTAQRFEPVGDGGFYLGAGGGYSPDVRGDLGVLSMALDRQLFWRVGLWVSGETFVIVKNPEPDLALRLLFGFRVDLAHDDEKKVRWIGTLNFAHQHEATLTGWRNSPFSNLFGESQDGLGHRSGVEVGTGLILTPWNDQPNFARRVRILARLSGQWLPDSKGPNFFLAFVTSVGVAL